jgi:hypothetical protein
MVSGPIDIADDTHLQLHPLAVIKRSLSMPTSTQMIRLAHAQRVLVEGGSLDGNKQSDVVGAGGQCTGLATAGAT